MKIDSAQVRWKRLEINAWFNDGMVPDSTTFSAVVPLLLESSAAWHVNGAFVPGDSAHPLQESP